MPDPVFVTKVPTHTKEPSFKAVPVEVKILATPSTCTVADDPIDGRRKVRATPITETKWKKEKERYFVSLERACPFPLETIPEVGIREDRHGVKKDQEDIHTYLT